MTAVDKSHVEAVINDVSRGSAFYSNEQRKASMRGARIKRMLERAVVFDRLHQDAAQRRTVTRTVARAAEALESTRELGVFIHVDMDMFFAAVEEKKNPELKSVPFGVGGLGMLSTTNYLARAYGVRAGMPGYIGLKLCPQLKFVWSDYAVYREESEKVRTVVAAYDEHYTSGGLDEFTLNVTDLVRRNITAARQNEDADRDGAPSGIDESLPALLAEGGRLAEVIRKEICTATQLTASCGVACTPCLAKIVGNYNKPNGQYTLLASTREQVLAFMQDLPVRRVPGVGKAMEEILSAFHVTTCGDIAAKRELLCFCMTPKTFEFMLQISLGVMGHFAAAPHHEDAATSDKAEGDQPDVAAHNRKSISHERTFRAVSFPGELAQIAQRNFEASYAKLVEEGLVAAQVSLKLKYVTFEIKQVSSNVEGGPTDDKEALRRVVDELLQPFLAECRQFRLLGVRLSSLQHKVNCNDSSSTGMTKATTPVSHRHGTLDMYFARSATHTKPSDAPRRDAGHHDVFVLSSGSSSSSCGSDDDERSARQLGSDDETDLIPHSTERFCKRQRHEEEEENVVCVLSGDLGSRNSDEVIVLS